MGQLQSKSMTNDEVDIEQILLGQRKMVEKVINFLLCVSKVVDQFDFDNNIVNQD